MAYLEIKDFKFGMDRRRRRVTGVPGTLWTLKNAHITRGGDIERAKKFVATYSLPVGETKGLAAVRSQLYVFGTAASSAVPPGVRYQQIAAPSGAALSRVLDVRGFDGKVYVAAEYADGSIHHFYDGARVTDWDTIVDSSTSAAVLASYLADKISGDEDVTAIASSAEITITARVPGTAFTLGKSTANGGSVNDQDITLATVQANVPAVTEVQASGVITITGGSSGNANTINAVTIDGTPLLGAAVRWQSTNAATAIRFATAINSLTGTHGYVATAVGAAVSIRAAAGLGAAANGRVLLVTTTGDVSVTSSPILEGGVTAVTAVAQISTATLTGTFEAADSFTVTVDGRAYTATGRAAAHGTSLFIFKNRVWASAGSLFRGCKLNTPTDWTDTDANIGAGFINVSNQTEGTERLTAAAEYNGLAALFSKESIRLAELSADFEAVSLRQSLSETGSLASRAVRAYGNDEVFYLDRSGVRSLRARDSSNAPTSDDIGNAMDDFVQSYFNEITEAEISNACSAVEPRDGRFLMALGDYVLTLSRYPRSKIAAWSYYDLGFPITDWARVGRSLYARSGDTIYLYGGADGMTYPGANEQAAVVQTPFMTADKIATFKNVKGMDVGLTNVWGTYLLVDPNDETAKVPVGNIHQSTYADANVSLPANTTHFALELSCSEAGAASISNMTVHFDATEAN